MTYDDGNEDGHSCDHADEEKQGVPTIERDPQAALESIVRQYEEGWSEWLENFEEEELTFDHLVSFAEFGTGDYYCFDYAREDLAGERPVVRWSHETGETEDRAASFAEFATKVEAGAFQDD